MLTYNAKVENGKLVIIHRDRLLKELQAFEGKQLTVCIAKKKKDRSSPQNRFYWGVCIKLILHGLIDAGWNASEIDAEVVHTFLKRKFLKKNVTNEQTGETISIINSTSKLTTVEFMDYIAEIQQFASQMLGVFIPDPNEVL